MTLEIKSERRNLTFGSGEPAITHEEAINTLKEFLRAEQIAEMSKVACASCDYDNNGSCDLLVTPGQCSRARGIAEAFYNADYRKQSGWISVDDRLPDKNTMVLGFIHNVYADGSYWDNILVMELNSAGYFVPFNCATIKDNRVTHWMPLPGAPKMKGCESDD